MDLTPKPEHRVIAACAQRASSGRTHSIRPGVRRRSRCVSSLPPTNQLSGGWPHPRAMALIQTASLLERLHRQASSWMNRLSADLSVADRPARIRREPLAAVVLPSAERTPGSSAGAAVTSSGEPLWSQVPTAVGHSRSPRRQAEFQRPSCMRRRNMNAPMPMRRAGWQPVKSVSGHFYPPSQSPMHPNNLPPSPKRLPAEAGCSEIGMECLCR